MPIKSYYGEVDYGRVMRKTSSEGGRRDEAKGRVIIDVSFGNTYSYQ